MNEYSPKALSLPELPESNLALLPIEEKINKLLSVFESIEEVNGYTIIKFKPKVILGSEGEFGLVSGRNLVLKTLDGGIFLN